MWRLTDEERELREHIRSVVLEQIRRRVRERVTTEAVQVLGGNGYLKDFPAESTRRE